VAGDDASTDDELIARIRSHLPPPVRRDPVLQLPKAVAAVLSSEEIESYGFPSAGEPRCGAKARRMIPDAGGPYGIAVVIPEIVFCARRPGHDVPQCTEPPSMQDLSGWRRRLSDWVIGAPLDVYRWGWDGPAPPSPPTPAVGPDSDLWSPDADRVPPPDPDAWSPSDDDQSRWDHFAAGDAVQSP
jgi:hypothetical protein